jgi:hypothetical protein
MLVQVRLRIGHTRPNTWTFVARWIGTSWNTLWPAPYHLASSCAIHTFRRRSRYTFNFDVCRGTPLEMIAVVYALPSVFNWQIICMYYITTVLVLWGSQLSDRIQHWSPTCFGKGPHPLLWTGSRATRGKIINGIPNCQNYCEIFIVCTHFTNVTVGCIIKVGESYADGRPRVGDPWRTALHRCPVLRHQLQTPEWCHMCFRPSVTVTHTVVHCCSVLSAESQVACSALLLCHHVQAPCKVRKCCRVRIPVTGL